VVEGHVTITRDSSPCIQKNIKSIVTIKLEIYQPFQYRAGLLLVRLERRFWEKRSRP